jgi:hypothetical protein
LLSHFAQYLYIRLLHAYFRPKTHTAQKPTLREAVIIKAMTEIHLLILLNTLILPAVGAWLISLQKGKKHLEQRVGKLEEGQGQLDQDLRQATSDISQTFNPIFQEINTRLGRIEQVLMHEKKSEY